MKYKVKEHGYSYNDDGIEDEYNREVEKEAVKIFAKSPCYCDGQVGWYLEGCSFEEATRIVKSYDAACENIFSDYATAYPAYGGYIIVVTSPYTD